MAPPTFVKSVRLQPSEVARFARLKRFFPEAASESDLIKLATVRGLALLEAEVAASGGGLPQGVAEDDLAAVILPRILPALTWLVRLGRLPYLFAGAPLPVVGHQTDRTGQSDALDPIDLRAAADIDGLGGDFLGDWPE